MIVRGVARVLVGDHIVDARTHDLVRVPPLTWHQFQTQGDEPLGFICMVDCERDVPERPDGSALAGLRANPAVAAFIKA
jgi:gentisate 1,2-dioxygenase